MKFNVHFSEFKIIMKVFLVLFVLAAAAVAFPTGEPDPVPSAEMQTEMKKEEMNTLAAVEGDPKGDNVKGSESERNKRFIFFGPVVYSYPYSYWW